MNEVHNGLELALLHALDALLAERNVTRAALRLGVTQSALSHMLGRLRTVFDDPLFVRTPRGVLPTERALRLAAPTARLLADAARMTAREEPFDPRRLARSFTLATHDYGEVMVLPGLHARLAAEAPGVSLIARPVPADLESALAGDAIDVAVGVFGELAPRLVRRKLFDDGFVSVVRRDHPTLARRRRSVTLDEYVTLDHVLISPAGTGRGAVDEALAALGRARRIVVRTASFLPALILAAQSDLVLTVPTRLVSALPRDWSLVVFQPPVAVPRFTVWAVWHERLAPDPAHSWFRRLVAASAAPVVVPPARARPTRATAPTARSDSAVRRSGRSAPSSTRP